MTRRHATIILSLCAVSAALAAQEYFNRHWSGGPLSYDSMLLAQLIGVAVWLVLAPTVVVPLARRFPLSAGAARIHLGVHGVAATGVSVLHLSIVSLLFASYYYGWSPAATYDIMRDRMHSVYAWSLLAYVAIVGAVHLRARTHSPSERIVPGTGAGAAPAAAEPAQPEHGQRLEAADPRYPEYARRILVRNDGRVAVVPVEQVDWLEADDNHVIVHVAGEHHTVRIPLTRLANRLDPGTFVRIHRSTVVNIDRVLEVQPWFQGELVVILKDQTRLAIGRSYRDAFLAALER